MADNIDISDLNDAIHELNRTIEDLASTLGGFSNATATASSTVKNYNTDVNNARQATKGLTEAEIARKDAQKQISEEERKQKQLEKENAILLGSAMNKASSSVLSFGTALLNTNVKLTNFNNSIGKAGDAAFELGKRFGPLGTIIGGLVKGGTKLLEAHTQQAQSLLDAKEQLNKLGGAGAHTTESIFKMAREADLNSETLGRMIKPIQSMGTSIMSLGSSAGEAQKNFAKLIQATDEERAAMQRLGINQEEMMQGTADYLALQSMSGRSIKNELQDREKLRRASLDYQTNLLDLAALTGNDVNSLKEKQKEQMLDRQVQIKTFQDQTRIDKLREQAQNENDAVRKKALTDEADAIQKEISARNEAFAALATAPEALRKGVKEIITTGTISGENAQILARNNMLQAVQDFQKVFKETGDGQLAAAKLQDQYVKNLGNSINSVGRSAMINEEIAKLFGINSAKELEQIIQRRNQGITFEQQLIEQRKNRQVVEKSGTDKASDAQALLQNTVIATTGKFDDLVKATNPLIGDFDKLKGATVGLSLAVGAATIALTAMSIGKGYKAIKGAIKGPKIPPIPPTAGAGAAGEAVAGAGTGAGLGKKGLGLAKGVLGKLAWPLAIASGLYDASEGFGADSKASTGQKILNAGSSALNGLTFGLLGSSADEIKQRSKATDLADKEIKALIINDRFDITQSIPVVIVSGLKNLELQLSKLVKPLSSIDQETPDKEEPKKKDDKDEDKQKPPEGYRGKGFVDPRLILESSKPKTATEKVLDYTSGKTSRDKTLEGVLPGELPPQPSASQVTANPSYRELRQQGVSAKEAYNQVSGKMGGTPLPLTEEEKRATTPQGPGQVLGLGTRQVSGKIVDERTSQPVVAKPTEPVVAKPPEPTPAPVVPAAKQKPVSAPEPVIAKTPESKPEPVVAKPSKTMSDAEIKMMIMAHEGVRYEPYRDSKGLWTVGVGHLIGDGKTLPKEWNRKFSREEVMALFDTDYQKYKTAAQSNVPKFSKYDSVGQGAFIDLTFNMGPGWTKNFPKASERLADSDPVGAAKELKDSDWYTQVGRRGPKIVSMVESSQVSARDGGLAMGPKSGYPATLHGNEMIVPLDPKSILADLGKKSMSEIQTQIEQKTNQIQSFNPESFKELTQINKSMMEMLSSKLDNMIGKLETGNDTQDRILRYSQV